MSYPKHTLSVTQLSCLYGEQCIFRHVDFTLSAGQLLIIKGTNGSGKTSLLRCLASLLTPSAGHIAWGLQAIDTMLSNYQQAIHYVGHQSGHKLNLTALENLRLLSALHLEPDADNHAALAHWNLSAQQDTLVRVLSAGQKRRLALARLTLLPKPLWLLDEPVTALDKHTQTFFYAELTKHLALGGMAVISSHHDLPIPAKTLLLGTDHV